MFWKDFWGLMKGKSLLARTQQSNPADWLRFYEEVNDIWLKMRGSSWEFGEQVLSILQNRKVLQEDPSILDLGCGSGLLSIPFARYGARVTSLDNSPAMIGRLEKYAEEHHLHTIKTETISWNQYLPEKKFDLVIAAFFPAAFSPEGMKRMEIFSNGRCALVFSTGKEVFPLRKILWAEIVQDPLPDRSHLLPCAFNFLYSLGRRPNCVHFSWKENLDITLEDAQRFYTSYFKIFGYSGTTTSAVIKKNIKSFIQEGRIKFNGTEEAALLWW